MIKKWMLKAIVQKGISYLPFSHKVNYLFQKYITKGVQLSENYFLDRLTHARRHLQAYQEASTASLATTLELGTGWYPVVPIAMFLRGATTIHTVDISALTDKEKILTTIRWYLKYQDAGKLEAFLSPLEDRFAILREIDAAPEAYTFESLLQKLHIHYQVVDIRDLKLESNTIDLIHSNNTFEHVYPKVLEGILARFKPLVKKGGVMSHFIDMSDHFAHFDTSINIYNFLQYSEKAWQRIDNSVQPQNRWRLSDYQRLYTQLEIPVSTIDARPGDLSALATITLDKHFQTYEKEDLAISHAYMISKI